MRRRPARRLLLACGRRVLIELGIPGPVYKAVATLCKSFSYSQYYRWLQVGDHMKLLTRCGRK